MSPTFIDTPASLVSFLDGLPDCKGQPPSLYVDLEGNNLCRQGTLSIITILVQPQNQTYLIDVTTLGKEAFTTEATSNGLTLKTILESEDIIKVFFDVRNDSDALFSLQGIHLHNAEDLQLFEFASRNFDKRVVHGLAKCIEKDLSLPYSEKQQWQKVKNDGRKLFAPEMGGSFAVFDQRPMSSEMMDYCAQDVVHMPRLREIYLNKLCDAWYTKIKAETEARIRLSHSSTFNGKGRHMALGPTGWGSFRPTMEERREKTLFTTAPNKLRASPTTTATSTSNLSAEQSPISRSTSVTSADPTTMGELLVQYTVEAQRGGRSAGRGNRVYQRGRLASRGGIHSSSHYDNGDDDDDDFDSHFASSSMYSRSPSEESSPKDLTACDKECGYCGHCPY